MATSNNPNEKIEHLEGMRNRLSSGNLTDEDKASIDQMITAYVELQKSLASSTEKIGDKTVLAKLPFGVDLVK